MKFIEFNGNAINIDNINMVYPSFNESAVEKIHDDEGELHYVARDDIDPFEIIIEFKSDSKLKLTYNTKDLRDSNLKLLWEVLGVEQ